MARALDEFASEADEIAEEQHQIAQDVRRLNHEREAGRSWSELLAGADSGQMLQLVRSSARRLASSTGRLMRYLAHELSSEGLSHRKIGRLLGVTHQRVTTILKSPRATQHDG
ncbi:MAG TPA: hypothetical protein VFV00_11970 [Acidimicrobiales bacterium]|nr:hypothetical protein [Acidimicrobiales bacterium]